MNILTESQIPSDYLRGFLSPRNPDFIWVMSRTSSEPERVPIEPEAVAQDEAELQDPLQELGRSLALGALSVIHEWQAGSREFSELSREILLALTAYMICLPAPEGHPGDSNLVRKRLMEGLLRHTGGRMDTEVLGRPGYAAPAATHLTDDEDHPQEVVTLSGYNAMSGIHDLLMEYCWKVLIAQEGVDYIASDQPVSVATGHPDRAGGLTGAYAGELEILFPLGGSLCLQGLPAGEEGIESTLVKQTIETNRQTCKNAVQFVFAATVMENPFD